MTNENPAPAEAHGTFQAWTKVEECIGAYWDAAYQEGKDARDHDDVDGTAQCALAQLKKAVDEYAIAVIASKVQPKGTVPRGMKLVPVTPTPEMLAASWANPLDRRFIFADHEEHIAAAWIAMLDAAPGDPVLDDYTVLAELEAICTAADAGAGGWVSTARLRELAAIQAPAVAAEKEQTSPSVPVDVSAFKDWTTRQKLGYVHQNLRWAACGYVHTPERIEGLRTCWKLITDILESAAVFDVPVQGSQS